MTISKELLFTECAAVGVAIDDSCADRLDTYAALLLAYNEKVNLTAITNPDDMVRKHFADSLALLRYVPLEAGTRFCDVGTGGGFPGAVLLCAVPTLRAVLLDSVNKKLEFVRFLLRELGLAAEVTTIRAEDAGRKNEYREHFDVVTARAVAELRILAEYCLPLVRIGGVFSPMKGRPTGEETTRGIAAAKRLGGEVMLTQDYTLADGAERHILVVKKVSQTATEYPRKLSQITKKPL